MTLIFKVDKYGRSKKGKKARLRKKYRRAWINEKGAEKNKYHREDWAIRIKPRLLEKFIRCNVGKSVDKTYSKFLEKCSELKNTYYGKFLHDEFYGMFKKKDTIGEEGGFYLVNGVIREKKRRTRKSDSIDLARKYNSDFIKKNKDKIIKLGLKASQDGYPKYIGKLYVNCNRWSWEIDLGFVPIYIMKKDILPLEDLDLKTRHHNYGKTRVIGYELGLKLENDGSLSGIRFYSDRPKEGGELFALVKKTI